MEWSSMPELWQPSGLHTDSLYYADRPWAQVRLDGVAAGQLGADKLVLAGGVGPGQVPWRRGAVLDLSGDGCWASMDGQPLSGQYLEAGYFFE